VHGSAGLQLGRVEPTGEHSLEERNPVPLVPAGGVDLHLLAGGDQHAGEPVGQVPEPGRPGEHGRRVGPGRHSLFDERVPQNRQHGPVGLDNRVGRYALKRPPLPRRPLVLLDLGRQVGPAERGQHPHDVAVAGPPQVAVRHPAIPGVGVQDRQLPVDQLIRAFREAGGHGTEQIGAGRHGVPWGSLQNKGLYFVSLPYRSASGRSTVAA
jgi:hypothetical protein